MDTRDMYLAPTLRPPGVGAYMNSPMVADQAAGAINAAVTRMSSANWFAGKRFRPSRKLIEDVLNLNTEPGDSI